jgi:RNA polymerase sigma-70 factor (ECF subfamily)
MRAAQHGDLAAYTRLVREIIPLLQRLLRARLGVLQAADRDDLMQDALLSLHRAMATYDPQREFVLWLMTIARNKMVDRARRCARTMANEVLVDDLDAIDAGERFAPCAEHYGDPEALMQAVDRLPAGQRKAIELLKIRELSSAEASGQTGMSSAALRVSVHRAIKSLRVSLDSDTETSNRVGVAGGPSSRRSQPHAVSQPPLRRGSRSAASAAPGLPTMHAGYRNDALRGEWRPAIMPRPTSSTRAQGVA